MPSSSPSTPRAIPREGALDPSFLICSERSGSNLIRSILNAHPDIYAPQPIHLGAFWERLEEFGDLGEDVRWTTLLTAIVDFQHNWKGSLDPALEFELEGLLGALEHREFVAIYDHFYSRGLAASGKRQLFIKENHTAQRARIFLAAYPRAKFVFQVRDPRDFLASCKRMPGYKYGSAQAALAVWCADQEAALALPLGPEQLFSLRYEQLLEQPERSLSRLCDFLEVPYAAQMLEFYKTEDARRSATHAAWRNLGQPLIRTNSGHYAQTLSGQEIAWVEAQAGALMVRLGYAPSGPSAPSSVRAGTPPEPAPERECLDDPSSSAAVQHTIDRHLGRT